MAAVNAANSELNFEEAMTLIASCHELLSADSLQAAIRALKHVDPFQEYPIFAEELELLETVAAKYVCGIPRKVQSLAAVAHDKLQHRRAAAAAEKLIVKQDNHTPETPTPRFRLRIIVVEEGVADLQITYE